MEQTNPKAKSLITVFHGRTLWPTAYVAWALMIANVVFPLWGYFQGTLDGLVLSMLVTLSIIFVVKWDYITNVYIPPIFRIITGFFAVSFVMNLFMNVIFLLSSQATFLLPLPYLPYFLLWTLFFVTMTVSGSPFRFRRVVE